MNQEARREAVERLQRANRSVLAAGLALAEGGVSKDAPELKRLRGIVGEINKARLEIEGPVFRKVTG